jgi:hypothetical protein
MVSFRRVVSGALPCSPLPHKGTQYLNHGGVIPLGILGDALQGVNPTESDSELLVAELLDGLGVPVGDVALLGYLKGPEP